MVLLHIKWIGPHLEMRWGTRGSSLVVGNSGFFSCCDGCHRESLELHKWSQDSFQVARGNSGLLSRHCREKGPHLALRGESRDFSRVVAGSSVFFSSCDMDLRAPLMLPQWSQASFWVAKVTLWFLSSFCRGIRHHLELRQEIQCSSPVVTGISGFFLSCNRWDSPSHNVRGAHQYSSRVKSGKSALISRGGGELGALLEMWREIWDSSWIATGIQGTSGIV